MSGSRVLISGASVAGPTLAYWLVRAGCKVTVVERAPSLRSDGQGVDVRDAARDVIKRMGLFDRIRNKSSHEEGIEVIDRNNRCVARFGVDESGEGESMTCDIEILRGGLAKILYDITKDDVSYIFGETVQALDDTEKEVKVHFSNGTPTMAFDLVIAADGVGSKIRGMAFGDRSSHTRSLSAYVAYFSIPRGSTDTMWSRVHWVKGGRHLWLRPDNVGRTRVSLILSAYDKSDERLVRLRKDSKQGMLAQKALLQELFQDADWETSRILTGMHESEDFYFQHVAQVRLDRWSSGRVAVVGDADYAPSPFTGAGTSMALVGAYVLAGEISRQPNDIAAALESYERILRPYFDSIQKLPPGIPWIAIPQSTLGVRMVETFLWGLSVVAATPLVYTLLSELAGFLPTSGEQFKLPHYETFTASVKLVRNGVQQ